MPRRKLIPSQPRIHKGSGQAYVRLDGRMVYLGRFGTPEAERAFKRAVAEWLSTGVVPNTKPKAEEDGIIIAELCVAYLRWAEGYYVKGGEQTSEVEYLHRAIRPLLDLYGDETAASFTATNLRAVRQTLIGRKLARNHVNGITTRIKRIFKWAAGRDLIPPAVHQTLAAVEGLSKGRSGARETEPVKPVPDAHVAAIKPHVASPVWALIQLQLLTGARSGELVIMRGRDLDMSGPIWTYRPSTHKTEHHDIERIIDIGPKAQKLIRPFLKSDLSAYLFDPREAVKERRANGANSRRRATQRQGKRKTGRKVRDRYDAASYRRAIRRGCEKAGVPNWHPHQLRHNYGTRIRKLAGVEAARLALGHQCLKVTELYAEADRAKVQELAAKVG